MVKTQEINQSGMFGLPPPHMTQDADDEKGGRFDRKWVKTIDRADLPKNLFRVRGWDLARTPVTSTTPNPNYTVGVLLGKDPDSDKIYVISGRSLRGSGVQVTEAVVNTAKQDGDNVVISLPKEPGISGHNQSERIRRALKDYNIMMSGDITPKGVRFRAFSKACKDGDVIFVRGGWNDEFFDFLEKYGTTGAKDDHADAISKAYEVLKEIEAPAE